MTIAEDIEQLKARLENTTNKKEQVELLLGIIKKYDSVESIELLPFLTRLQPLVKKLNQPVYLAWCLHYEARLKCYLNEFAGSIKLSKQSLNLFKKQKDKQGMAASYSSMGKVYYRLGDNPKALKNHLAALEIVKELGDLIGMAGSYVNIGVIQCSTNNYPEAIENTRAALKIFLQIGNPLGIASCYANIALLYKEEANYTEALKNYFAALKVARQIGNQLVTAIIYQALDWFTTSKASIPKHSKIFFTL